MDIKRKITCKYLKNQYNKATKYLEKQLNRSGNVENMDIICNRIRRAGVAYAQAEYCAFMENGSWSESLRSVSYDNCSITVVSLYEEFISEMERNIQTVIHKHLFQRF